jgi:DNA-binding CsgD family transcriptional regulator
MTAAGLAAPPAYPSNERYEKGRERFLERVIERSAFVAVRTDNDGIIEWASGAFAALVTSRSDFLGASLFTLGEGRATKLHSLLRAVRDVPGRQATAEIDFDGTTPARRLRITAECLPQEDGGGVLWWQNPDVSPDRVDRLTHALMNIAREVDWVGFGRRRAATPSTPIGLLAGAEQLGERERTVATMLATGDSVATIASRLFVSPSTVRNYLSSMYRKLGVRDLNELRDLLARGLPQPASLRVVEDAPST